LEIKIQPACYLIVPLYCRCKLSTRRDDDRTTGLNTKVSTH